MWDGKAVQPDIKNIWLHPKTETKITHSIRLQIVFVSLQKKTFFYFQHIQYICERNLWNFKYFSRIFFYTAALCQSNNIKYKEKEKSSHISAQLAKLHFFTVCPTNHCITSIFLLYIILLDSLSFIWECPKWTYGRRHISGCLQSITFEELFLTKTKYFSLLLTKRKWIKRFFWVNFFEYICWFVAGCVFIYKYMCMPWMGVVWWSTKNISVLSFYVRLLVYSVIMKIPSCIAERLYDHFLSLFSVVIY